MAPAPKKKTSSAVAKKTRLSQAEATVRMLNATTQLLLEFVPGEVTVLRICEKAGVHTDYVVRYFGSREELLSQAIEAAFLGVFLRTNGDDSSRLSVVLEGNVDVMQLAQARVQTIA
jgi:AcrR family transcriptional regulator